MIKAAALLMLCAALAACDGPVVGSFARSGMGSPMRYDDEPVKVQVGNQRYIVPANCFDSPLEVERNDNGYAVVNGMLFAMLLPDLQCRTRKNSRKFQITDLEKPGVWLLVSKIVGQRTALGNIKSSLELDTIRHSDFVSIKSNNLDHDSDEEAETVTIRMPASGELVKRDVFKKVNGESYIVCDQPRMAGSRPIVPHCAQDLAIEDATVRASYDRGHLQNRANIERAIRRKMDEFKVEG